MKRVFLLVLIATMVSLSGCGMISDGGEGESDPAETAAFSESVTFPWTAITGEAVAVEVTVENTGNASGSYEAVLSADGEDRQTRSTTVGAGESETITLEHTFEEPGEYNLTVGPEETTITVYESIDAYFEAEDPLEGETEVIEQEATVEGTMIFGGQALEFQVDSESTIRKNNSAETQYQHEEMTTSVAGDTENETTESWIVDGTRYEKTTDHSTGEVSYTSGPSDEFEDDDRDIPDELLEQVLEIEETDGEYIISITADRSDTASALMASLDAGDDEIPPESITRVSIAFTVDKTFMRPTSNHMEFSATNLSLGGESGNTIESMDMTLEQEIVALNEPVEVDVPNEVITEAAEEDQTGL